VSATAAAHPLADAQAQRPLRADARRNRDALLEAASAAFTDNGVDTSLEDVAKRAGVGIGTLYRHFPTRDALIEAAYRRGVEQLCDVADELRATHEGDEALELWMRRFVGYVATKRGLAGALKLGDGDHSELFAYVHGRITGAVAQLLDAAAATGRVRSDVDSVLLIRAVSGICMAGNTGEEHARQLIALLMDGLRFGAPANGAAK
jgi:AcrR family transcriptional regulator